MAGIRDDFNGGKDRWFRDAAQRERVRHVVHNHLADDARQEECRYLMRFWWHLAMSYQEVSYQELLAHLSSDRMAALEALFDAIDGSPEAVDAWCVQQATRFPDLHPELEFESGPEDPA